MKKKLFSVLLGILLCASIRIPVFAYTAPVTEDGISPDTVSTAIPHTHNGNSSSGGGCYGGVTTKTETIEHSEDYARADACGCEGGHYLYDSPHYCPHGNLYGKATHRWTETKTTTTYYCNCGLGSTNGNLNIVRSDDAVTVSLTGTSYITSASVTVYGYDDETAATPAFNQSYTLNSSNGFAVSIPREYAVYNAYLNSTAQSKGNSASANITGYKDNIFKFYFLKDDGTFARPTKIYVNGVRITSVYFNLPSVLEDGDKKRNYLIFGH